MSANVTAREQPRLMRFFGINAMMEHLRRLYAKGGGFARAAKQVTEIIEKIPEDKEVDANQVFGGIRVTKHGEDRIQHCVKYDLTSACRLVTVQDNGVCVFCYLGTHNEADDWIEKNRGFSPLGRKRHSGIEVTVGYASNNIADVKTRVKRSSDLSSGPLYKRVPERYFERLVKGLPFEILDVLESFESITCEDRILEVCISIENNEQATAVYDAFVALRQGDVTTAKNRIDHFAGNIVPLKALKNEEIKQLIPGEEFVDLGRLNAELLDHFVKTVDYRRWMLFLHPAQRSVVDRDFNGSARLSGVSGSGKTCVVIKRAIRLAEKYTPARILVLTLNKSLATLIRDLVDAAAPSPVRHNIVVNSLWQFCQEKLIEYEPHKQRHYGERTFKPNPYADPEHVDEVWVEWYHQENNNPNAEVLFSVHKSLVGRGVFPLEYLRQELDYVRSALPKEARKDYLRLDRVGRSVPLDAAFRDMVLNRLDGWEKMMERVGVTDYLGLAAALYRHLDKLRPEFRCVLVDEAQDFGTIELSIIRRLAKEDANDIFLVGDMAQQVYTKHHDLSASGINITGRSVAIRQNYRNSREILAAAYAVLTTSLTEKIKKDSQLEILDPEFANFSSPKPLLLKANFLGEEFAACLNYFRDRIEDEKPADLKLCIAVCGFPLNDLEKVGKALGLPVLAGETSLSSGQIFLSDLEQTKGFEFDSIGLLNCNKSTIPTVGMPEEEWYRDLSKFYVAMTRAKRELIVSFSSELSGFIEGCLGYFVAGEWSDYAPITTLPNFTFPRFPSHAKIDESALDLTGKKFLYSRKAIGLTPDLQDKLMERVEGNVRRELGVGGRMRQIGWRTVRELLEAKEEATPRTLFGPESWDQIKKHLAGKTQG